MFSQSFAFLEEGIRSHEPLPLQQNHKRGTDATTATAPSSSQHGGGGGGGLFKTNIFGTTKRPGTSGGAKVKDPQSQLSPDPTSGLLARKTSFRGRFNSTPTQSFSPEKRRPSIQHTEDGSPGALERKPSHSRTSSSAPKDTASAAHPTSRRDSHTPAPPLPNMLARPGTSYSTFGATGGPGVVPPALPSPTLENITYLHIQETSSKRISTLDYLRKAYVAQPSSKPSITEESWEDTFDTKC